MSIEQQNANRMAGDLAAVGDIRATLLAAGVSPDLISHASGAVFAELEKTTGALGAGTNGMLAGAGKATGSTVAQVVGKDGDAHTTMDDVTLRATGDIPQNLDVSRA